MKRIFPINRFTYLLLILLLCSVAYAQSNVFLKEKSIAPGDQIYYAKIKTDSLFNSLQVISLLILPKKSYDEYGFEIGYSKYKLKKTSMFGRSENAVAAINGSFFDVDKGGSVTYLEVNDSVISTTRPSKLKWAKPDSLIDGAVIISKDFRISIQSAKPLEYYEHSKQEAGVIIAGPLLLFNSKKVKLPNMDFVNKRHPRTFLCTNDTSVILIAVDGRKKDADGMSLTEAQEFLLKIGCADAINLDGGGSTTMWIKNRGLINSPSDKQGERPVANAILIFRK